LQISEIAELKAMASRMRKAALSMTYKAGQLRAHIAPALSIIDICAVLYGKVMKIDASNPQWKQRDRFLLSKGHGSLGLYTALAEVGFLTPEELKLFELPEGILPVHPVMCVDKGIEISSGSLGLGLAVGIGISLAEKRSKAGYRTYVLMGDGECNEGSVWEAAMAAAHFKLDTLTAVIDFNGMQSDGPCNTVMNMNSHESKWKSFGWETRCVDGHDVAALYEAFVSSRQEPEKPLAIIARTTKGKGVSFMENNNEWHHNMLTQKQYDAALLELAD
jgi:transketolase